jgi:hypothetical protein
VVTTNKTPMIITEAVVLGRDLIATIMASFSPSKDTASFAKSIGEEGAAPANGAAGSEGRAPRRLKTISSRANHAKPAKRFQTHAASPLLCVED